MSCGSHVENRNLRKAQVWNPYSRMPVHSMLSILLSHTFLCTNGVFSFPTVDADSGPTGAASNTQDLAHSMPASKKSRIDEPSEGTDFFVGVTLQQIFLSLCIPRLMQCVHLALHSFLAFSVAQMPDWVQ